ncbi:MAG TPA: universal stress protein [Usitatibacter sp.]|nr:universal stress protein [Usitatibacter sp.]
MYALAHSDQDDDLRVLLQAHLRTAPLATPEVLLAVDDSYPSVHATRYVARTAAGLGACVHLLHVSEKATESPSLLRHAWRVALPRRTPGLRILVDAAKTLAQAGVDHTAQVAIGTVAETIARIAQERGALLVVMGVRDRHALANLVTGSLGSRVARISPVPLLLVRHSTRARLRLPARPSAPYIGA